MKKEDLAARREQIKADVAYYKKTGIIRLRSFKTIRPIIIKEVRESERLVDQKDRISY